MRPTLPVEETLIHIIHWLKFGIEAIGAALVVIGVVAAVYQLIKTSLRHEAGDFIGTRLTLGRYLALALEFQLAGDIIATAVAPSWPQIGKLAAIALIRTGLNFFLMLEMKNEHHMRASQARAAEK